MDEDGGGEARAANSGPDVSCQTTSHQGGVGGRLALFANNWIRFRLTRWHWEVLTQGYRIPFMQLPRYRGMTSTPLKGEYAGVLLDEVESLLGKGAIRRVSNSDARDGFYSTYFLVPKKTGDLRPILNLKPINGQVRVDKFKMETLARVITAIQPGCWMAAIDLKDAYFHVPIHPSDQKYLRFRIENRSYQYQVLPFGLSTSPRTFTKVLQPVIAFIRMQGVHITPYLDDILVTASDPDTLTRHVQVAIQTLESAGYVINLAKSSLTPSQDMVYIGARLQTSLGLVSLPPGRATAIIDMIHSQFAVGQTPVARTWLSLIGKMTSCLFVTKLARLRMRHVQYHLDSYWRRDTQPLSHPVLVTDEVYADLTWWLNPEHLLCGLPLSQEPTTAVLTTDASSRGWGAVLGDQGQHHSRCKTVQGKWDWWQEAWHINRLELEAVRLGLTHFVNSLRGQKVLIRSDNTTTCAYINHYGGTRSWDLCLQAVDLWDWCLVNQIELKAAHVPGVENVLADFLSRQEVDQREWSLHQKAANKLFWRWGRPDMDLFATIHNRKVLSFCSMYPSRIATHIDAFSINWTGFSLGYAFPPVVLLHKVLQKVRQDRARLILIAPMWPGRSWYSMILHMLVDYPRRLPSWPDLLTQCRVPHPNPQSLQLMAWRISGVTSEAVDFQHRLVTLWQPLELQAPSQDITLNGRYTCAGVMNGAKIPILPL